MRMKVAKMPPYPVRGGGKIAVSRVEGCKEQKQIDKGLSY